MPVMKSLRSFRLDSTDGHVLQVVSDKPIFVPEKLLSKALAAGMVVVDEVPDNIPDDIPDETPEVSDETSESPDDTPDETSEDEQEEEASFLNQALMLIITRGDESDFKGDGTPKVSRVNAELPPEADRVTATQVSDAFAELQESIDLAE